MAPRKRDISVGPPSASFARKFRRTEPLFTSIDTKTDGLARIPEQGAAIIKPNHVSFVDALILGGCIKRPVRFVMYYKDFRIPVLNFIFRTARAIPIAGQKEDPELYTAAFEKMNAALQAGELLCIFPEGQITHDRQLNEFRPSILRLLEKTPVPVIPRGLARILGKLVQSQGWARILQVTPTYFCAN